MEAVLNCCSQANYGVPFYYPLTSFPDSESGKFKQFSIENGFTKVILSDDELNADKKENDMKYTVTADKIDPEIDDEKAKDFREIFESTLQGGKVYYPDKELTLTLVFTIFDEGIFLDDASTVEIKDKNNEEEEEKAEEEEKKEDVSLTDYISQCVAEKPSRHKCCSEKGDCEGKPVYIVPRYLVALKKVMEKFPKENPASLKRLVTVALDDPNEPCYACVACNSDYLAVAEIAKCAKINSTPKLGLPPKEFQPLSNEELFNKKKLPVGIGNGMSKPYSFSLNLKNSPYGYVPMPKEPPKPKSKLRSTTSQLSQTRSPEWAERLSTRHLGETTKSTRPTTALKKPEKPMQWPPFPDKPTVGQILARKVYKPPALPYNMIEKKRRKRLPPREHPEGEFNSVVMPHTIDH